jgi:plastocyanin
LHEVQTFCYISPGIYLFENRREGRYHLRFCPNGEEASTMFVKKSILAIPVVLLIVALVLFGCGKVPGVHNSVGPSVPNTTVQMAPTNFVQSTRTIQAGQSLLFDDTVSGGGLHIICLGTNQICDSTAQGPSDLLHGGFTINPGATKSVAFPTAGTYKITCTVHPNMNLTVTVQ